MSKKKWKKGDDVNFNNIGNDLDNYKMDEHIYKEIPDRVDEVPASVQKGLHFLNIALQKSSKLSVRQSIRIAKSVKNFNKSSTFLALVMIALVTVQIILFLIK